MKKYIFSVLFCLCIGLILFPQTILAENKKISITIGSDGVPTETSGTGWSYSNSNLTLNSGYEFIITDNEYKGTLTNKGILVDGIFGGSVTNTGTINGGTFNNNSSVTNGNKGIINGGTFYGKVNNSGGTSSNKSYIKGGTFYGKVTNANPNYISGGIFQGTVVLPFGAYITGGTFYGEIEAGEKSGGQIAGGSFYGNIDNFLSKPWSSIKEKADVTFAINYEINDGTWMNTSDIANTYKFGTTVTLPNQDDIYKYGYTFMGWYDNQDFNGIPITKLDSKAAGTKTFYAKFVEGDVEQPIYDWEKAGNTAIEGKDYDVENGNYTIYTALGLAKIANIVNSGNNLLGKVVTLANDIDLYDGGVYDYNENGKITTSNSWIPINGFSGTFNGNGNKIENLYIYANTVDSISIGLFGTNNGTINDLVLNSGSIYLNIAYSTSYYNVPPIYYVGGIAARTSGVIDNCENYVSIDVTSDEDAFQISDVYIGGIAASSSNSSIISNCKNYGKISSSIYSYASVHAGGIAGIISSIELYSDNVIDNCYNEGTVIIKSDGPSYAGGIVGFAHPSGNKEIEVKIINNGNVGTIGAMYVGGIAGFAEANVSLINNYNLGDVSANDSAMKSNIGKYAGGIIGYIGKYNDSIFPIIINSYNAGAVSGGEKNGGIVGILNGGTITNSYLLSVSGTNIAGTQDGSITDTYKFTKSDDKYIFVDDDNNNIELIYALNDWVFANSGNGYSNWKASSKNDNYPIIGVIEYFITFDPNDGVLSDDVTNPVVTTDGKLQTLPVPTRVGYTFDGWFNGEVKVSTYTIYTENTTLTAKWVVKTDTDDDVDIDDDIDDDTDANIDKDNKPIDNVDTGDDIVLYIILLIISLFGIVTLTYKIKRVNKKCN